MIVERPLYSTHVIVWYDFWSGGVTGRYFFENEADNAVIINVLRYQDALTNFSCPIIHDMDVSDIWFQQDGATCLTSTKILNSLQNKFPNRIISLSCDFAVNW